MDPSELSEDEFNLLFKPAAEVFDMKILESCLEEFTELLASTTTGETNQRAAAIKSIVEKCGVANSSASESTQRDKNLLRFAAVTLNSYIRQNYTGPPEVDQDFEILGKLAESEVWRKVMTQDGEEMVESLKNPILVWLAEVLLDEIDESACPTVYWWRLRAYFLHQRLLEEKSQIFKEKIMQAKVQYEAVINRLANSREIGAVFYAELSAIYAYYYDIEGAKSVTSKAKENAGIIANPTGVLGKRTRFQQHDLAQLVLHVEKIAGVEAILSEDNFDAKKSFPESLLLEDEVRLEKINLCDEDVKQTMVLAQDLSQSQHLVLLSDFQLKHIYLPSDEIYREELLAYLNYLIDCPKVWGIQIVALLNRSILEKSHRRTVERSMKQLQTLRRAVDSSNPPLSERLKYFFSINMPMAWELDLSLCKVLSSLNLYKEALDIYLKLRKWEEVIQCYTDLNLRHKAEEVIREQLENNETVKLWTLLGDATGDTAYYKKAWTMSGMKSARAKRQWGFHYFQKKMYKEAVMHLEESLKLNPLENPAWLRLGFAALEIENWEVSAKAYQYSTTLDADNFEAWNNLAKAFVKLGHKKKALRALKEATKCNYDNWKVWENTLIVAVDCRAFDEVIRSYNRLFDLKGKWVDEEVLAILIAAITIDKPDSNENPCRQRYMASALTLFGRITATITNNPKIWKLYSDLLMVKLETDQSNPTGATDTKETLWYRSVTFSQKSVQAILADQNWSKAEEGLQDAVDFTCEYMTSVHQFVEGFPVSNSKSEALTNAQFTVRKVYNAIKKLGEQAIQPEKFEKLLEELKLKAAVLPIITLT